MMPLWTTTMRPVAVAMRVRVLLGRTPVRRPARVADAELALERMQLASTSSSRDSLPALRRISSIAVPHDRDARRVVAAILQPSQAFDEHRHERLRADVPDNAAHGSVSSPIADGSRAGARPSRACFPDGRARSPSASAGTSSVMEEPAATYAPLADAHGRDELRVAADEHAVLDHRLMLLHAVVVARDRAGADVDVLADGRVAEVREMVGLRSPRPSVVFLSSTKLPTCALFADIRVGSQVRERADARAAIRRANPRSRCDRAS